QTIQEQAQEIQRLTIELDRQIELFAERGKKILQLEGTIKALEDANSGLSGTNKELQHQINKLKNELEQEKQAHKNTKITLEEKISELKSQLSVFKSDSDKLDDASITWQNTVDSTT
ncbi:MAG: hypothetical protein ACQBVK_03900, partial [Candidatus Phytoplasma sp. TWB_XP]